MIARHVCCACNNILLLIVTIYKVIVLAFVLAINLNTIIIIINIIRR